MVGEGAEEQEAGQPRRSGYTSGRGMEFPTSSVWEMAQEATNLFRSTQGNKAGLSPCTPTPAPSLRSAVAPVSKNREGVGEPNRELIWGPQAQLGDTSQLRPSQAKGTLDRAQKGPWSPSVQRDFEGQPFL